MKTAPEVPDGLFRQAQAAVEGRKLKDLVTEGLGPMVPGRGALSTPRRVQFPIIEARQGESLVTKKMVDDAEEQMLKEEAEYYANSVRR